MQRVGIRNRETTSTSSLNYERQKTLYGACGLIPERFEDFSPAQSPNYLKVAGNPSTPDDLRLHRCVGSGPWRLSRGKKVITPEILFRVVTSDPTVALKLALGGFGI